MPGALETQVRALPLSLGVLPHVSSEQSLEEVEVASLSLNKLSQLGQPTITVPPNSVLWIKMIRSRFLLIQLPGAVLHLWDLIHPAKCIASCSLDGTVDGAVVEDEEGPRMTRIFLSTRSCTTYQLYFEIPGFNESLPTAPRLAPSVVFRGLSHILDAKSPLFALSYLEGRAPGAFIKDQRSGAVVELVRCPYSNGGGQSLRPRIAHNGIIDIRIFDDIIAVARTCNLELYHLSGVVEKFSDGAESGRTFSIQPYGWLEYPNLESPVYRGSFLRLPNPYLGIDPGALALFSTELPGCYGIASRPGWSSRAASGIATTDIACLTGLVEVTRCMFTTALGPSGHRFARLSDEHLTIYFTSRRDSDSTAGHQSRGGMMASWMIPGALGDIPVALDFDEATGRCVAAMASGRVWVKETTNFLSEPRVFPLVKLLPDFEVIGIPNPDPARWPVVMPFPTPDPFGNPPASALPPPKPKQVAPRWSDEVDKYFPYKNRPDCYGGTPWLIHEALHIPVVRPGHHPPSVGEYGARTVLFTVEQTKPNSPFYDEVIEVRPLPGSDEGNGFWLLVMDCGNWEFYRLKPVGGLDDIVAHLQHGGIGKLRESDEPWPADERKLDQLSRWMYGYDTRFGKLISKLNLT